MRVLGINDEQTVCDCCGKKNLKRTVVLEPADGGEVVRYGVDCAARALGRRGRSGAEAVRRNAEALELGRKWLAAGYTPKVVGDALWNRYGLSGEVRGGVLRLGRPGTHETVGELELTGAGR